MAALLRGGEFYPRKNRGIHSTEQLRAHAGDADAGRNRDADFGLDGLFAFAGLGRSRVARSLWQWSAAVIAATPLRRSICARTLSRASFVRHAGENGTTPRPDLPRDSTSSGR